MYKIAEAFSLIELMIVIVIIGILSAISIPSYKSYVIRSRLAELFIIADKVKSLMAQKHNDGVAWTTLTDLGLPSNTISTKYISSVAVNRTGASWATHCTSGTFIGGLIVWGNSSTIGVTGTIGLIKFGCVSNDIITWECASTGGTVTAGNNIYFPTDCQDAS